MLIGIILSLFNLMVTPFLPVIYRPITKANNLILMSSSGNQSEGGFRKGQEMKMEMSSLAGAKAIAKLDINERTKRAMLAEAVEDRIFEITEEIEEIFNKNDGVLEGDQKDEAVELAKQTKALQVQYDDLVNGRPSYLLNLREDDNVEEKDFQ